MKTPFILVLLFVALEVAAADVVAPQVALVRTFDETRGQACAEKPYVYITSDAFGEKPNRAPYGMYLCTTRVLTGEDADWISQNKSLGSDVSLQLVSSPSRR